MQAYPLHWPQGIARNHHPKHSKFKTSFGSARDELFRIIKRMKGTNIVLSTNIPLRNDGLPYARYAAIEDTGVAMYFTYQTKQVVFACDKWILIQDNMQAVCKTLAAIRENHEGQRGRLQDLSRYPWHGTMGCKRYRKPYFYRF